MRRDMGICGWCGDGDGDRWWGYGHMRGGHMWVGVRLMKRKGRRGGEGDRAALDWSGGLRWRDLETVPV
jgi:hypothetical protein